MKKRFVILEQGCEPNYPLTTKHKEQFNTKFSDCFRLNWTADRTDTGADFFKDNICWSEGRSYLYEQVKGKYDYYIFIDDDMAIESNTELSPAEQINDSLEKYKPIHGSIVNECWPNIRGKSTSEALTMMGADLCVQFFSESFADLMFPTWLHGSEASMWYAQFLAHMICPRRSIFLNLLDARNVRSEEHEDAHTKKKCTDFFKEMLTSQQHKTMFIRWKPPARNKYTYVDIKPHTHFLDITAEDIEKYINIKK